jgi:hypothetical protein
MFHAGGEADFGSIARTDSPKTLRNRREVARDAAGSDVRGYHALAIFIGEASKHIAVAVGDLRFAEKPRNERHGLVARCQSFELASLRGVYNRDAKPSCQVTWSLPEEVSAGGEIPSRCSARQTERTF